MKFVTSSDEIMKVFVTEDQMVRLEFERGYWDLTPLEAHQLSEILKDVTRRTEYFQGLKNPPPSST